MVGKENEERKSGTASIQANFNDKLGALPLFLSAVHETREAFNNLLRSPTHCGCLSHLPTILLKDSSERVWGDYGGNETLWREGNGP